MIELTKKIYLIIFALSLFIAPLFYSDSLNYYFFQDDFFEINISKAANFQDYLSFFKFRDDIIAYRPVSLQNYFFLSNKLFDLNPVGFRLIVFSVFLVNAYLVAKVIHKISGNKNIGLLTSSFWVTSSIHFMTLSWIAAAYNLIGTFFWLLTSILFLNFVRTNRLITYHLALITFLLTIGSFEFSITWPVIFGFYYFFVLKNSLARSLKLFLPFIAISIVYLVLRLLLIKIPQIIEYKTTLNFDSLKALFWYVLWSFNIPEEFKKQIATNLIVFNPKFSQEYWPLILKTFYGAILIITAGTILPSVLIFRRKLNINIKFLVFFISWFLIAVSPVLLLPNHTFSMYLTLASIGIYSLLAYLIVLQNKPFLVAFVFILWVYTAYTTLSFYKVNSWIVEAQSFAKTFSSDIKKQYPYLPKNSIIYFPHQDHRHEQALLQHHALRTFYNDQSLLIYYNKEELLKAVTTKPNHPVYIFTPR